MLPTTPRRPSAPQSKPVSSGATRAQKIEWYTDTLIAQGTAKEKAGNIQSAIEDYLKAVDILMLLARDQGDYNTWRRYADKAGSCQQRVRLLIH